MKKILAAVLAVLMLFAVCACSATKETAKTGDTAGKIESDFDYIKGKGKMVIGITYFEPMNFMDKDGKLTGFETDFATAVCEKLGVEPEFQEINWDSKEVELSGKTIDCIWNGMTITDERKENMGISTPYMSNKQVIVTKSANLDKFKDSVKGAAVVAEQGSAGEDLAKDDEFFKEAKFTPVDSQTKALMEVLAGTADAAIVDYVLSIGSIGEGTDFADLKVVEGKEFSPEEYGIAFRKGSDTADKVNEAIKALAADGTLKEIAEKYKLEKMLLVK